MVPALDAYTRSELKASEDAVTLSRIILFLAGALSQVNEAVNQMDQSTQQNVGMVEETRVTSRAIRQKSEILRQQIRGFELSSSRSSLAGANQERQEVQAGRLATHGALALAPSVSHVTDNSDEF